MCLAAEKVSHSLENFSGSELIWSIDQEYQVLKIYASNLKLSYEGTKRH